MMTTLRHWCVLLGLWLARWGGWQPWPPTVTVACAHVVPDDVLAHAWIVVREVARQGFQHGEQKRHHALRAMLNRFPDQHRACALAIELASADLG